MSSDLTVTGGSGPERELERIRKRLGSIADNTSREVIRPEQLSTEVSRIDDDLQAMMDGQQKISAQTAHLISVVEVGFTKLATQLALQGDILKDIRDAIEAPLANQARELRRRGERAFRQGWVDQAERDLQQAIETNYQDYLSYLILGHIAQYEKDDLEEACERYEQAAKYAGAFSEIDQAGALLETSWAYGERGLYDKSYSRAQEAEQVVQDVGQEQDDSPSSVSELKARLKNEPMEKSGVYDGQLTDSTVLYQTAVAAWRAHGGERGRKEFAARFTSFASEEPWWVVVAENDDRIEGLQDLIRGLVQEWSEQERDRLVELREHARWLLNAIRKVKRKHGENGKDSPETEARVWANKLADIDELGFVGLVKLRSKAEDKVPPLLRSARGNWKQSCEYVSDRKDEDAPNAFEAGLWLIAGPIFFGIPGAIVWSILLVLNDQWSWGMTWPAIFVIPLGILIIKLVRDFGKKSFAQSRVDHYKEWIKKAQARLERLE